MNWIELSGHITFILIACSFLVQNILSLRVISLMSSIAAIIYNYYALDKPLWLVINWNIVFILINILNIAIYFYKKRKLDLTPQEKEIYENVFKDLSHTEFMNLIQLGKVFYLKKNTNIVSEGKNCESIILIITGKVKLLAKGNQLAEVIKGRFIGEDTLFTKGKKAFITARVDEPTKCLIWQRKPLLKYLKNNLELQKTFTTIINKNIGEKLKNVVE